MGGQGIVLLLAVVNLVSGARPHHPHRVGLQPALTAAVGALTNSTGDEVSLALVENQQDAATGPCYKNDFETKESTMRKIANNWWTNKPTPRTCARVWGRVVCHSQEVEFGDASVHICGKNEIGNYGKFFKANGCQVFFTKSEAITVKGEKKCLCQPCRFSVLVREQDGGLWQTTWGHVDDMGVRSVWETGTKQTPSLGTWRSYVTRADLGAHSVNVWISGHPVTVSVIKVLVLVIIGAATGGLASIPVVIASAAWTGGMLLLNTWNKYKAVSDIANSEMSGKVKAACAAVQGTKWVLAVGFGLATMIFPFSETMGNAANGATSLGAFINQQWTGDATGEALASYGIGVFQGVAVDKIRDTAIAATKVECTDYTDVDDGYAMVVDGQTEEELGQAL